MNRLLSITEVVDVGLVASDFRELLLRSDNADITREFPGLSSRYTREGGGTLDEIKYSQDRVAAGEHEKFVVFAGQRAVGLGVITRLAIGPDEVAGGAPNLSGFIANPYRGIGLGRLSLEYRLDVVNQRFDHRAWTSVSRLNKISRHLIESTGFDLVAENNDRLIFTYDGSSSQDRRNV